MPDDVLPAGSIEAALGPCSIAHGLDDPCLEGGLQQHQAVFWNGTRLPATTLEQQLEGICSDPAGGPDRYLLPVAASNGTLHVDVQVFIRDLNHVRPFADVLHQGHETGLSVALYDPSGRCVDTGDASGLFGFGLEADAAPGDWQIRVDGTLEEVLEYRMRAHIKEGRYDEQPSLPDLRIIAPFEISFFVPTATILPGVPLPIGLNGASCMAEEVQEAVAAGLPVPTLCLRFSMGLFNSAPVPLVLRGERDNVLQDAGLEDVALTQVQCNAAGLECQDLEPVPGLVSRWHQTHLHYHYQNAYVFDLYRVDGEERVQVGTSGKLGLDPTNEAWDGWNRFDQGPQWGSTPRYGDGASVPVSQRIQPGWGDIYDWNRAGNYIDFPTDVAGRPVPGEYVILGVTDPLGQIAESNETNNEAYAHFTVSGLGAVDVHERGFGRHPWDVAKDVQALAP